MVGRDRPDRHPRGDGGWPGTGRRPAARRTAARARAGPGAGGRGRGALLALLRVGALRHRHGGRGRPHHHRQRRGHRVGGQHPAQHGQHAGSGGRLLVGKRREHHRRPADQHDPENRRQPLRRLALRHRRQRLVPGLEQHRRAALAGERLSASAWRPPDRVARGVALPGCGVRPLPAPHPPARRSVVRAGTSLPRTSRRNVRIEDVLLKEET